MTLSYETKYTQYNKPHTVQLMETFASLDSSRSQILTKASQTRRSWTIEKQSLVCRSRYLEHCSSDGHLQTGPVTTCTPPSMEHTRWQEPSLQRRWVPRMCWRHWWRLAASAAGASSSLTSSHRINLHTLCLKKTSLCNLLLVSYAFTSLNNFKYLEWWDVYLLIARTCIGLITLRPYMSTKNKTFSHMTTELFRSGNWQTVGDGSVHRAAHVWQLGSRLWKNSVGYSDCSKWFTLPSHMHVASLQLIQFCYQMLLFLPKCHVYKHYSVISSNVFRFAFLDRSGQGCAVCRLRQYLITCCGQKPQKPPKSLEMRLSRLNNDVEKFDISWKLYLNDWQDIFLASSNHVCNLCGWSGSTNTILRWRP